MSSDAAKHPSVAGRMIGRSFVSPWFDYLLIGGGLSFIMCAVIQFYPPIRRLSSEEYLPYLLLVFNSAHLASTTVRLYTIPGNRTSFPFLTMVLPILMLVILTICIALPHYLGRSFLSIYLTWSPYHYAAQAYGLACMYSYRSGCMLAPNDKKLLWWVSMIPFIYIFISGGELVGLQWLVPARFFEGGISVVLDWVSKGLAMLCYAAPLALFYKIYRSPSGPMPVIGLLMLIANASWFILLELINAVVWATVFHSVQYLAIVLIFHVKDQQRNPSNHHGAVYHVVWFYGLSVVLAYGLTQLIPRAFVYAGFGGVEATMSAFAAINIHHFIVDAYIWRLKKGDANREIVEESLATV